MVKRSRRGSPFASNAMKLINSFTYTGLFLFLLFPCAANGQKLESGTAGAMTTPQYAKKVAQTYCDFIAANIGGESALSQAEKEVEASASKPEPFDQAIYKKVLQKAVKDKGCKKMPELPVKSVEMLKPSLPKNCNLSVVEMYLLEKDRRMVKRGKNCMISITAH